MIRIDRETDHVITLSVNGRERQRRTDAHRLLSDFLRHDLGLTGTHVGCEHGVCGACTVLIDGKACRSCLTLAVQADGRRVDTVESLAIADAGTWQGSRAAQPMSCSTDKRSQNAGGVSSDADVNQDGNHHKPDDASDKDREHQDNVDHDDEGGVGDAIGGEHDETRLNDLQLAFARHDALQCGFCTAGILMSCTEFLARHADPDASQVREMLSGHLCRCTGYTGMVSAVLDVAEQRRGAHSPRDKRTPADANTRSKEDRRDV